MKIDPYQYFLQAFKAVISKKGYGYKKIIALECEISRQFVSQVLSEKNKASFKMQAKIAEALNYDYLDFLQLGKKIIEGEKPKIKEKTEPETELEKRLNDVEKRLDQIEGKDLKKNRQGQAA